MRSEMLDRRERYISGFYEANEQPKNCPNCNSTVSRITHTCLLYTSDAADE